MPYIGNSPKNNVRSRFYYTASASQTLFSGADINGRTLKYQDGAYVDVYLNGVLLQDTIDYTATTKTSITLVSGATAGDLVEIVAYGIFSVSDTVSAANGGTFDGQVIFNAGATGVSEIFSTTIGGSDGTSDWTGSGPYTAVMTVSGILSTDVPIADLDLSSVAYADVSSVEGDWTTVYRISATAADEVTFFATAEPANDLPVQIKVVR